MNKISPAVNVTAALLFSVILTSCFEPTPTNTQPPPEDDDEPPIETTGGVAPDGILESVTWNLEWYGIPNNGPDDEAKQTANILTIIDTLKADLYAFQEVDDQQALHRITSKMSGFRGFVAEEMGGSQRTAFVYNTQTIDSVSSGLITANQDEYDWASGRFPFYFKFDYTFEADTVTIYAVVIHAKCCANAESYTRRKAAAESLYNYLTRNKPDANIIFLGDYNDDVDESIYNGNTSPYHLFVSNDHFKVITRSLSLQQQSTTVGYQDAVDHITMSNELYNDYIIGSKAVFTKAEELIENYGATTSDHYPVWVKFDFRD